MKAAKQQKICSRGHRFTRSSDCPVCPMCWPGYYKKHGSQDFMGLSAPAQRALLHADIHSPSDLTKYSEKEILALHGMGPASLPKLRQILQHKKLHFKK